MNNNRKIFIHGGSSLISKYLIEKFSQDFDEAFIFCRDLQKTKDILEIEKYNDKKFIFFENNLNDLEQTLNDINKLPNDLNAIFWVTGITGNPDDEFLNVKKTKLNYDINLINPSICISFLSKKILKNQNSFICVFTSVAGLRGRKKRLYYSSAKAGLLTFLSGLRQKYNSEIKIFTIIPGYISTNSFTEKANNFLISSPEKCAELVYNNIKKNNEIIYVSYIWKIIMMFISFIPEKLFKKLKF